MADNAVCDASLALTMSSLAGAALLTEYCLGLHDPRAQGDVAYMNAARTMLNVTQEE